MAPRPDMSIGERVAYWRQRRGLTQKVLADRIIQEWEAGPGSLTLLRGPGLLDAEDGRPFHTVHGPAAGRRFSITFRINQQLR
jgi:hypothetical protein